MVDVYMQIIIDAHIHSKYSRATSQDMNIKSIARYAKVKGLDVVGTGDFTHPKWLREIKESLVEIPYTGLYQPVAEPKLNIYFMMTAEVYTHFNFEGKERRIHHVIWAPNLEVVDQINDVLSKYGSLEVDGRPLLRLSAPSLIEEVMAVSEDNFVFPAHAWTPWFSIFGAFGGFDSFEECYQDQSHKVSALETGLSSDPPMNWRLSSLDRLAIISNSDCHSHWPWRLGREATVLDLQEVTYLDIIDTIRSKDPQRFLFTIETDPAYGKYHWTGHRGCRVSMPPSEAIRNNNRCPVCGRGLTKGVQQRVEELADRPMDYNPRKAPSFIHLLPLSEIISTTIGAEGPSSQKVWSIYNSLINRFRDEYTVLLKASTAELRRVVDTPLVEAILQIREGKVQVIPGYDGVYGRLQLQGIAERRAIRGGDL